MHIYAIMTDVFHALADPTRLRIVALVRAVELSVGELAEVLDQSQPRVSRHLKLMTDAGLIERFPDGARVYYRLSHDAQARRLIDTVLDILADPNVAPLPPHMARLSDLPERVTRVENDNEALKSLILERRVD